MNQNELKLNLAKKYKDIYEVKKLLTNDLKRIIKKLNRTPQEDYEQQQKLEEERIKIKETIGILLTRGGKK